MTLNRIICLLVIQYGILLHINNATSALLLTSCNTPVEANTSLSPNTYVLCNDDVVCLSFETTSEGHLTVTDGSKFNR